MNALPLLPLILFATAPAMEPWGLPDLAERDKQGHFAGGFAIGAIAAGATKSLSPRSTWWTRYVIGIATTAVVAAAKEAIDSRTHAADPKDALATIAGGTCGALALSAAWHF